MHLALIGYGEVGRILAEDLRVQGHDVTAFDVKLRTSASVPLRGHSVVHGVTLAESHVDAVTANQTVAAAAACAPGLRPGSFFLDFNSASPGAKITAAEHVARHGGRYIEGAVMTAVPAQGAAAAGRTARGRCPRDADPARLHGARRERVAGRRERHQDVPQRP